MNKQKSRTLLKVITLCFLIAFLFWQCESETVVNEETKAETSIEIIDASVALIEISDFSTSEKNNNSVFEQINLEKKVKKINHESGKKSYTLAIINDGISSKTDDFVYSVDNLSIELNTDGTYTTHIFRYTPDMSWFNNPYNEINSYTGEIMLLNTDRDVLNTFNLVNGEEIENSTKNNLSAKSNCITTIVESLVCYANEFVEDCHYSYDVNTYCSGGGGNSGDGTGDGNSGGGGGTGNGDGGITTNPIIGSCIETNTCEDLIINELTGKADCIYDKLESSNSNLFKETIGKFIDDPEYDLIFRIGNCTNTDTACTNGSNIDTTGDIIITLEDIGQPDLELAATILHEGIHAEIFRYVHRFESGIDPNERARLLQLYSYYKGLTNIYPNDSYAISDAQHVYMAEKYVKSIAESIRKLDSYKYPLDHYMWYGWEGLDEYDYQDELTAELKTAYNNYQTIVNQNTDVNCN